MKSVLSAIGSSLTPALLAILVALNGCQVSRQGVSGVPAIGSIQIGATRDCPDPGPDPSPAPKPPDPQPIPCPCPDPGPSPSPAPEPIPVPVPPTPDPTPPPPPAPVVVPVSGPLYASLIYDGGSIDAAVQTAEIRTDQTILSQISGYDYKGWHVYESTHPAMSVKTSDNPHGLGLSTMVTIQPGMAVVLVQGPDGHKVATFPSPIKTVDLVGSLRDIKYGGNP